MKKLVLVVGDTIIDEYVYLQPIGFSLETPTIKSKKINSRLELGGAANVAIQMAKLGCQVDFITSVSSKHKKSLEKIKNLSVIQSFDKDQIKQRFYLVKESCYKYLQINDCLPVTPRLVLDESRAISDYDSVVISDYRLGVVTDQILKILPKHKTICQMQISDSNAKIDKFSGFHCFVGNSQEIPRDKLRETREACNFDVCVSTNGKEEIVAVSKQGVFTHLPKKLEAVNDYHGAGDAFFAGFCTKYQSDNLQNAISFGATNAYAFLTRSENVVI